MKDMLSQYVPIAIGTVLGACAHFGRVISDIGIPPMREIIGFIMQLGLVALVAAVLTEQLAVTSGLIKSLTASVLTVAANEVVAWARKKAQRLLNTLDKD